MKARFGFRFPGLAKARPSGSKKSLKRFKRVVLGVLLVLLLLGRSNLPPGDPLENIRYFTRSIEFDFVEWTLEALGVKLEQAILGTSGYLPTSAEPEIVLAYLETLAQVNSLESQILTRFADPDAAVGALALEDLQRQLDDVQLDLQRLEPVAESILQDQLGVVAAKAGLSLGGQTIPPALFHTTPAPFSLIVSPRHVIRQDFSISLSPDLSLEERVRLENQVDRAAGMSSLVVGIGGVGTYPTMVTETTDINWLTYVIAHEWIHNYLTLRPLGLLYLESPALRTMNETAATIAGKELGRRVVELYYPAYLPPPEPPPSEMEAPSVPAEPPAFDYRRELHETRVRTDELLEQGKVVEAEAYMEERRQFLWENGYRLRKINQAFFAFHGAYADEPDRGAAGEDPVGAAVRLLRQQSPTLRDFINRIAWMSSFEQLKRQVAAGEEG